jgi:hypothetical protein
MNSRRLNSVFAFLIGLWGLSVTASLPQSDQPQITTRVTAEQLDQTIARIRRGRDQKVAEQLSGVELTERPNASQALRWMTAFPGPQAKLALRVIIDQSAFLDPPIGEIVTAEKPGIDAQRQMIGYTVDYVNKMARQLPNLYATRTTRSFEKNLSTKIPLRFIGKTSGTVLYRDGEENFRPTSDPSDSSNLFSLRVPGLATSGEFGPVLVTAILDAAQGNMVWTRWERGAAGLEAVFRYEVTAEQSHYMVEQRKSGYSGEIAIDPSSGTILRLALKSDLQRGPMTLADMMVEYGPTELGGKTYTCPIRSVALSVVGLTSEWLNDVVFDQYHLYSANARMLPGFKNVPETP